MYTGLRDFYSVLKMFREIENGLNDGGLSCTDIEISDDAPRTYAHKFVKTDAFELAVYVTFGTSADLFGEPECAIYCIFGGGESPIEIKIWYDVEIDRFEIGQLDAGEHPMATLFIEEALSDLTRRQINGDDSLSLDETLACVLKTCLFVKAHVQAT